MRSCRQNRLYGTCDRQSGFAGPRPLRSLAHHTLPEESWRAEAGWRIGFAFDEASLFPAGGPDLDRTTPQCSEASTQTGGAALQPVGVVAQSDAWVLPRELAENAQ